MRKAFYDMFRIPYYHALVVKDGEVIRQRIVRLTNARPKYFRVKGIKAAFILPTIKKHPPIRIKSGYLVVYDMLNAQPMELALSSDSDKLFDDFKAVESLQYVNTPLDIEELHNFLEAKVTEDILADNEKTIPLWLIYLVSIGIIAVALLGTVYMITKGGTPVYVPVDGILTPTPTPTPGYIVTP